MESKREAIYEVMAECKEQALPRNKIAERQALDESGLECSEARSKHRSKSCRASGRRQWAVRCDVGDALLVAVLQTLNLLDIDTRT